MAKAGSSIARRMAQKICSEPTSTVEETVEFLLETLARTSSENARYRETYGDLPCKATKDGNDRQKPTEGVRRQQSMSELRAMWNSSSGNEGLPKLGTAARKACDAEVDELLTRLRRGDAGSGRRAAS